MAFYYYFLNPDGKLDEYNELSEEYPKSRVFYRLDELSDFVQESVNKYYSISTNDQQMLMSKLSLFIKDQEPEIPYLWP